MKGRLLQPVTRPVEMERLNRAAKLNRVAKLNQEIELNRAVLVIELLNTQ